MAKHDDRKLERDTKWTEVNVPGHPKLRFKMQAGALHVEVRQRGWALSNYRQGLDHTFHLYLVRGD